MLGKQESAISESSWDILGSAFSLFRGELF